MLRIFHPEEAKNTILKRNPIDDYEIPESMQQKMLDFFGENLTPDQAVSRIIKDVRSRGDHALRHWTLTLDNTLQEQFRINEDEIQSCQESISADIKAALIKSIDRVRAFHLRQPLSSWISNDLGGTVGQLMSHSTSRAIYSSWNGAFTIQCDHVSCTSAGGWCERNCFSCPT